MLYIPNSGHAVRALKHVVRSHLASIPSSHLSEALAFGAGERTHASLLATLNAGRSVLTYDDERFLGKLGTLGHSTKGWPGFDDVARQSWAMSPHRSPRAQCWRNMMAAAVNSGIAQGLFTLDPDGNLWPGHDAGHGKGDSHAFDVAMPNGIPAAAYVNDIGFGELAIHVALWPKDPTWLRAAPAGFAAGDAVAAGWLERKNGHWLMFDKRGGMLEVAIRRNRQIDVQNALTIPLGYSDHGKFIM